MSTAGNPGAGVAPLMAPRRYRTPRPMAGDQRNGMPERSCYAWTDRLPVHQGLCNGCGCLETSERHLRACLPPDDASSEEAA